MHLSVCGVTAMTKGFEEVAGDTEGLPTPFFNVDIRTGMQ